MTRNIQETLRDEFIVVLKVFSLAHQHEQRRNTSWMKFAHLDDGFFQQQIMRI
jgi:hypothetical protein